jgi:hypothetical protein
VKMLLVAWEESVVNLGLGAWGVESGARFLVLHRKWK